MTFTPSTPLETDFIDESQPILRANFEELDAVFDVDHYKFSDATGDKGKHNSVTTPNQGSHLSTAANEPKFYGYQRASGLGVMQWSRPGSDGTPTPLTNFSGTIASLTTASAGTAILNFAGLARTSGFLHISADAGTHNNIGQIYPVLFNGVRLVMSISGSVNEPLGLLNPGSPTIYMFRNGDDELRVQAVNATLTNVWWTLSFERLQ